MLRSFSLFILANTAMAQPAAEIVARALLELQRAVEANGLLVETLVGMQMSQTPWLKVTEAIRTAEKLGEGQ
jgi:hypothetical protein